MTEAAVLVTGGGGFLGREVVRRLRSESVNVVILEHRWATPDEVVEACADRVVSRCIHLGWYADPVDYLSAVDANLDSLARSVDLVRALEHLGCPHLVIAGSSAEYAPKSSPVTEDDAVGPSSMYGACKASLRLLLSSSLCPPTLTWCWARIFNVSGPGESPRRIIPTVVTSTLRGEEVELSPGDQVRDFLTPNDVARALAHLSAGGITGTFNVSSGTGIPLREMLTRIVGPTRSGLLKFGRRPYGRHDPPYMVGDNSRLRSTGWAAADGPEGVIAAWRGWLDAKGTG